MHTGMLWFDSSSTSLDIKINKAAEYYQKKYGRIPNVCLVHPSMLKGDEFQKDRKITIRSYQPVLPGHLWIGNEDKN